MALSNTTFFDIQNEGMILRYPRGQIVRLSKMRLKKKMKTNLKTKRSEIYSIASNKY